MVFSAIKSVFFKSSNASAATATVSDPGSEKKGGQESKDNPKTETPNEKPAATSDKKQDKSAPGNHDKKSQVYQPLQHEPAGRFSSRRYSRDYSPRRRDSDDFNYTCGCRSHPCGRAVEAPGDLCYVCLMHG